MGGSSKRQTVGYRYYLGVHMVLCHGPVDSVSQIRVDNKLVWTGAATGGPIYIDKPEVFGGDKREGGIRGTVDIMMGGRNQPPSPYLSSQIPSAIPAYRGVVSAVLRRCYVGLNPYLKRWAFRATRIMKRGDGLEQWYPGKAAIGNDMNPAHIIRECLTDSNWGMGYPEADIDDNAFKAAADTLHDERMGMSLLWERQSQLDEFISLILKHIDGALFVDRVTGRFVLRLARDDYDPDALLVLDEDSIDKISGYKRSALGELTNSFPPRKRKQ